METIAQKIQGVFYNQRSEAYAPSVVVQTIGSNTLQVFCSINDEGKVNSVMSLIQGWNKTTETRLESGVVKTYKSQAE